MEAIFKPNSIYCLKVNIYKNEVSLHFRTDRNGFPVGRYYWKREKELEAAPELPELPEFGKWVIPHFEFQFNNTVEVGIVLKEKKTAFSNVRTNYKQFSIEAAELVASGEAVAAPKYNAKERKAYALLMKKLGALTLEDVDKFESWAEERFTIHTKIFWVKVGNVIDGRLSPIDLLEWVVNMEEAGKLILTYKG